MTTVPVFGPWFTRYTSWSPSGSTAPICPVIGPVNLPLTWMGVTVGSWLSTVRRTTSAASCNHFLVAGSTGRPLMTEFEKATMSSICFATCCWWFAGSVGAAAGSAVGEASVVPPDRVGAVDRVEVRLGAALFGFSVVSAATAPAVRILGRALAAAVLRVDVLDAAGAFLAPALECEGPADADEDEDVLSAAETLTSGPSSDQPTNAAPTPADMALTCS